MSNSISGVAGQLRACRLIKLPVIQDPRGNLTFIEGNIGLPFDIARVYYLYEIPEGVGRGGHAHKALQQFIVPTSGSFDVLLDDGTNSFCFHLNCPYVGLYVCPMIWRELRNFASGSVCLVLASDRYDEQDYYRDYNDYLHAQESSSV